MFIQSRNVQTFQTFQTVLRSVGLPAVMNIYLQKYRCRHWFKVDLKNIIDRMINTHTFRPSQYLITECSGFPGVGTFSKIHNEFHAGVLWEDCLGADASVCPASFKNHASMCAAMLYDMTFYGVPEEWQVGGRPDDAPTLDYVIPSSTGAHSC